MLNRRYEMDLTDAAWELVKPLLPAARHGGRPRTTDMRAVVNAIFYLLRTPLSAMGHGLLLLSELGELWDAALATPPRLEKEPLNVFNQEEAVWFLSAVKGPRLEALFTVGLSLGMREGEILGLRCSRILKSSKVAS